MLTRRAGTALPPGCFNFVMSFPVLIFVSIKDLCPSAFYYEAGVSILGVPHALTAQFPYGFHPCAFVDWDFTGRFVQLHFEEDLVFAVGFVLCHFFDFDVVLAD